MKSLMIVVCAAVLLAFSAMTASAEVLFSVSVDVPVAYDFSSEELNEADPAGYKVLVSLPFFLGIGYEDYQVALKGGTVTPVDATFDLTLYDLFFTIPVIDVMVGVGAGKGLLDTDPATNAFEEASMRQFFLAYGIEFGGFFDIHLAYHSIDGEANPTGGGTVVDLGSTMWTLGLKVGF